MILIHVIYLHSSINCMRDFQFLFWQGRSLGTRLGGGTVTHQAGEEPGYEARRGNSDPSGQVVCSFEAQIIWEDVPNNLILTISEVDSEAHPFLFVHMVLRHHAYIVAKIIGEEGNFSGYSLR